MFMHHMILKYAKLRGSQKQERKLKENFWLLLKTGLAAMFLDLSSFQSISERICKINCTKKVGQAAALHDNLPFLFVCFLFTVTGSTAPDTVKRFVRETGLSRSWKQQTHFKKDLYLLQLLTPNVEGALFNPTGGSKSSKKEFKIFSILHKLTRANVFLQIRLAWREDHLFFSYSEIC